METNDKHLGITSWIAKAHRPTFNIRYFNTSRQTYENPVTLSIPVPGLRKEELIVYVIGNRLFVKLKNSDDLVQPSDDVGFIHSFVIPKNVDVNSIKAKCRHGILTVTIKKNKSSKKRLIPVAGANEKSIDNNLISRWLQECKASIVWSIKR